VTLDVELVLDARADLGEGPAWDADARRLIWVDITAGVVHRFDPTTGRDEAIEVRRPVGAAVPTTSGGLIIAARDGFSLLDPATGEIDLVAGVDATVPATLMNDGACDAAGRFWAGTKDVEGRRPLGSLFRLDADLTLTRVVTGVTISNGLGWSPDQRTMYYIDSATHAIDAFDFEIETGAVSHRRRLVELPKAWGLPDGMTVDEEGFLWVAFWTGSAIRRLSPVGEVDSVIELPVSLVTSCAFGGDDLSDLYVTSARVGLSEEQLEAQPHAGGLFRLSPGVRGPAAHPFAGSATTRHEPATGVQA
jgi:sugar lactone lactonase YvrE